MSTKLIKKCLCITYFFMEKISRQEKQVTGAKVREGGIKAFDEHANECTNSQRPSKVRSPARRPPASAATALFIDKSIILSMVSFFTKKLAFSVKTTAHRGTTSYCPAELGGKQACMQNITSLIIHRGRSVQPSKVSVCT